MAGIWRLRLLSWLPVVVAVAACAGMGGVNKDSPPDVKAAVVKERAQARWQALIKGDLDAAYAYLSPASKAATSLEAYKRRIRPGLWQAVTIDSVECETELCYVKLQLTYDIPKGRMSPQTVKGVETPVTERWVIEEGTAWYVFR